MSKAKRYSADEQLALVRECRSSGYSDHQWCIEHDINPGTFYNWVKRLRKKHIDLPAPAGRGTYAASAKQEVVRVEVLDGNPIPNGNMVPARLACNEKPASYTETSIEISFGSAVIKISNDVDPGLLSQILGMVGGTAC